MKSAWISAGLLVWALQGHAAPQGGVDGGGGGKSVVCRNSKGQITSAQTLDLFEAKNVYNLKLTSYSGSVEEISVKIQAKFSDAMGAGAYDFGPFYRRVNKIMKLVPPSSVIKPIDDAAEVVLPKDCQLEQLAHYVDDETLLVSQEIWDHLSNTEKAALISHEAVYRVDRSFGAKDSRRARRIVASLFSDFTFEPVNGDVPKTAKTCSASQNGRVTYQFSYFPSEDGKKTVMQFQWFDGKPVFTKKTATFPIGLPWLKNLPRKCEVQNNCHVTDGELESKFEGAGTVGISRATFTEDQKQVEMFYIESPTGPQTLNCNPGPDENLVTMSVSKSNRYAIPANGYSCYSVKLAQQNGTTPESDVQGSYFSLPRISFQQSNPKRDLWISAVKIYYTPPGGSEMMCALGGDSLAALSDDWWYKSKKNALIPAGTLSFQTDCPIYCGGIDVDTPFTATGMVKVYGYSEDVETGDAEGFTLSAPITITNF
jgi:hypothetical protein